MKNREPEPYVDGIPDLNDCEREPIHIPGSIERNGALIVLGEPELKVVQVSNNTGQMLGTEPRALLGTELSRLLQADSFTRLNPATHAGLH